MYNNYCNIIVIQGHYKEPAAIYATPKASTLASSFRINFSLCFYIEIIITFRSSTNRTLVSPFSLQSIVNCGSPATTLLMSFSSMVMAFAVNFMISLTKTKPASIQVYYR